MADDTCAYLEHVVGGAAHLVGWSDGAVVAIMVAMRRPDLVLRLVLMGQYYNSAGRSAAGEELERLLQSPDAMSFLREGYDPFSPDGPGHFTAVYEKTLAMLRNEPEIDLAEIGRVSSPTLVLQGDRDITTVEHSAAVVAALPNGRLAVLPGTHALPVESPNAVNALLHEFLLRGGPEPAWF
jgi:pimeloyl-ACP methyl ester carboxylesterase